MIIFNAGAECNQVLRTALALAAASGVSLRLTGLMNDSRIAQPGLGPGHYAALAAAAFISGGKFSAVMGGGEAKIFPKKLRSGYYFFDVAHQKSNSAPISWLVEVLLPGLALVEGKSHLFLSGGTHIFGSLSTDMLAFVLVPLLEKMGVEVYCREIISGFYPKGGGEAEIEIKGNSYLRPLILEGPFNFVEIKVEVVSCGLPVHLAEQALDGAINRLELYKIKPKFRLRRVKGVGYGMAMLVWGRDRAGLTVGFSSLGKRGRRPEAMALDAVEALTSFKESTAGLTAELATYLMIPMVLAQGVSQIKVERITPSLRAAVRAVESIWPGTLRIVRDSLGRGVELSIFGRGLLN